VIPMFLWVLGCMASFVILSAFAFMKGGPGWYPPVFGIAAGYCLVAIGVSWWRKRQSGVRDSWRKPYLPQN
jgi:hypothetical protein